MKASATIVISWEKPATQTRESSSRVMLALFIGLPKDAFLPTLAGRNLS